MTQAAFDSQAIAQFEKAAFGGNLPPETCRLDNDIYCQAQLIAPDFTGIKVKSAVSKTEIDSIPDIFGAKLAGQNLLSGRLCAQSSRLGWDEVARHVLPKFRR